MLQDTYNNAFRHKNLSDYIKEIEDLSNRKIIYNNDEAEKIDVDIIVATPFCRKPYSKA